MYTYKEHIYNKPPFRRCRQQEGTQTHAKAQKASQLPTKHTKTHKGTPSQTHTTRNKKQQQSTHLSVNLVERRHGRRVEERAAEVQQRRFSVQAGVDAQPERRQLGRPEGEARVRAVVAELRNGLGEGGYDRLLNEHNLS